MTALNTKPCTHARQSTLYAGCLPCADPECQDGRVGMCLTVPEPQGDGSIRDATFARVYLVSHDGKTRLVQWMRI